MNMKMTEDGNITIAAPTVAPHSDRPVCKACGFAAPSGIQRIIHYLVGHARFMFPQRLCRGGKPPVEEGNQPLSFEEHGPVAIMQMVTGAQTEKRYACAGIDTPHMHVTCPCCHNEWLMDTREAV